MKAAVINISRKFNNSAFFEGIKLRGGPLIALIVIMIAMSFSSKYFMTTDNMLNLLRQIATTALVTYGITFCLISGNIDLSAGSVVALSGVIMVSLMKHLGLNFFAAMTAGILTGTFVGLVNGLIVSRTGMAPFIVTLAMQSVIRGCAYFVTGGLPVQVKSEELFQLGTGTVFGIPIPIIIVVLLTILCSMILNKTVFGRNLVAAGGNREAAQFSGINTKDITLKVYMLSGTLIGIAGVIMAARMYSGQPTAGSGLEGDGIGAAIIGGTAFGGGTGSIYGSVIGVCIIGVINNGMNLLGLSMFWQLVVKGVVLLIALYIDAVKKNRESRV
jgi:ribose transport system permease protein